MIKVIGVLIGILAFIAGAMATIEILLPPLLFIALISYLLCSSDGFYLRHPRLITAGGSTAAIVGLGLIPGVFVYPVFK